MKGTEFRAEFRRKATERRATIVEEHRGIRTLNWGPYGGPYADPKNVIRTVTGSKTMSHYHVVHADLSALRTTETGSWNFIGPEAVPAGDSPLRPAVDEEPPDLGAAVRVGHCPFYLNGKMLRGRAPTHTAAPSLRPSNKPVGQQREPERSPRTYEEVRHHVLQSRPRVNPNDQSMGQSIKTAQRRSKRGWAQTS